MYEFSLSVKPEDRPSVTGFKTRHRVGDTLQMTCYINNTFPAANLTWFVTGKRVRRIFVIFSLYFSRIFRQQVVVSRFWFCVVVARFSTFMESIDSYGFHEIP